MTEYAKIPGYEGLPEPTARYRYLVDLLRRWQRRKDYRCSRPEHTAGGCPTCPLRIRLHLLGAYANCCNWEAEAVPDEAVRILEDLLREEAATSRRKETADMRRSVNLYWEPERPLEPDEPKPYYCPCCGEENPTTYYLDLFGRIVGCNYCTTERDAAQWEADHNA